MEVWCGIFTAAMADLNKSAFPNFERLTFTGSCLSTSAYPGILGYWFPARKYRTGILILIGWRARQRGRSCAVSQHREVSLLLLSRLMTSPYLVLAASASASIGAVYNVTQSSLSLFRAKVGA